MSIRLDGASDEAITDINITPFVDIILVVLIIFMVTATYIVSPSIKVNLPDAATGDEGQESSLGLTLLADGTLFLNGEEITETRLVEFIRSEKARDQDVVCLIAADRDTRHGSVVHLLDVVRQEGVARFAINIEPVEPPPAVGR
ncbi:MAG: biopolymer transporter ExbD [Deltaproteobacteria bacterium]|nr:biopolymer transporter ExbD [Deltaproteobacteria bacterium]